MNALDSTYRVVITLDLRLDPVEVLYGGFDGWKLNARADISSDLTQSK